MSAKLINGIKSDLTNVFSVSPPPGKGYLF